MNRQRIVKRAAERPVFGGWRLKRGDIRFRGGVVFRAELVWFRGGVVFRGADWFRGSSVLLAGLHLIPWGSSHVLTTDLWIKQFKN